MGNYSYGNAYYDYKLTISIEDLVTSIMDNLNIKGDDWELDDTNIIIYGSGKCRYKHWHCDASQYDPSEDETELIGTIDESNLDEAILDALEQFKEAVKTKNIYEIDIDEKSIDCEPDEPDPDVAYDRWKDSLLEEP